MFKCSKDSLNGILAKIPYTAETNGNPYKYPTITVKDGESVSLELCANKDVYITENANEKFKNISIKCKIPNQITAPITKDEKIGEMTIYYKNSPIETVDLLASADVNYEKKPKEKIYSNFKKLLSSGC